MADMILLEDNDAVDIDLGALLRMLPGYLKEDEFSVILRVWRSNKPKEEEFKENIVKCEEINVSELGRCDGLHLGFLGVPLH
jgi:hypothetical protein